MRFKLRAQSATSKIGSKFRLVPLVGLNAPGPGEQQFYVVLGKDGEQDQITEIPEFVQDSRGMYICATNESTGSVPTISMSPIKEEDVITVHLTGDVNGQPLTVFVSECAGTVEKRTTSNFGIGPGQATRVEGVGISICPHAVEGIPLSCMVLQHATVRNQPKPSADCGSSYVRSRQRARLVQNFASSLSLV